MAKKIRKGISAPLGVIFGVLLAIILVILAVFIAFNISTSTVKSQSAQISIVGTPVLFYNPTKDGGTATKLSFVVYNPTEKEITVKTIILKGEEVTVKDGQVSAKKSKDITVDVSGQGIKINWTEIYRGYVEFTIITDTGSLMASAQLIEVVGGGGG